MAWTVQAKYRSGGEEAPWETLALCKRPGMYFSNHSKYEKAVFDNLADAQLFAWHAAKYWFDHTKQGSVRIQEDGVEWACWQVDTNDPIWADGTLLAVNTKEPYVMPKRSKTRKEETPMPVTYRVQARWDPTTQKNMYDADVANGHEGGWHTLDPSHNEAEPGNYSGEYVFADEREADKFFWYACLFWTERKYGDVRILRNDGTVIRLGGMFNLTADAIKATIKANFGDKPYKLDPNAGSKAEGTVKCAVMPTVPLDPIEAEVLAAVNEAGAELPPEDESEYLAAVKAAAA